MQLTYDGSAAYAERRWHPILGTRDFIGGLEQGAKSNDIDRARRSFSIFSELAKASNRTGRPELYDDGREAEFFEDLQRATHCAVRAGEDVNISSLARHMGRNWRTVKNAVEDFEFDTKALEAEALACTHGRSICRVHTRRRGEFKKKQ